MQPWTVERQSVLLRVCKDKNGWANSVLKNSGLVVSYVPEGFRLRGIALEMQTIRLLHRLVEYGVRAKLQVSFGCKEDNDLPLLPTST